MDYSVLWFIIVYFISAVMSITQSPVDLLCLATKKDLDPEI